MEQLIRGRFGRIIVNQRHFYRKQFTIWTARLVDRNRQTVYSQYQRRHVGMFVLRAVRGVLKIRYLILGGAVAGGGTLHSKYNEWKDGLPDLKWMEDIFPDNQKWQQFRGSLISLKDSVKNNMEMDPRLVTLGEAKYSQFRAWFDQRLDDAIEAAEHHQNLQTAGDGVGDEHAGTRWLSRMLRLLMNVFAEVEKSVTPKRAFALPFTTTGSGTSKQGWFSGEDKSDMQQRLSDLQDEMIQTQIKYQRELERLERENRELRRQNILLKQGKKVTGPMRKVKRSLIDMYSEVLDELSDFDSSYNTHDQLPRVVVVGDQSSGKTSVLEMIAQARIFPRGAGEMMTRAPVKVTLSEGPYHVAQFRDSQREFDLTKEQDLADLRKEVELRMRNSVKGGKTVSSDVISMTVKGPGLQRMVLVDLPGIISTVTTDMALDTRECIKQMTQAYMNNPNAIILCIQDGSVDAERSNVTDLVAQCDPSGKRTIFVLTKVDMAEQNLADPNRIRKILSGKLFPMRALGYFAVVTGRGRNDDAIETIRDYEENFFRSSKLFKDGAIRSTQVTTRNLSLAVSDCFWKMVRATVEQQADAFKARRFNLETEWKNNYPRLREQDRDELFERARNLILDEVISLSQLTAKHWEQLLLDNMWQQVSSYVFDSIYVPAAQGDTSNEHFNTTIDIKLRQWAEQTLPEQSVDCGWQTLQSEFQKLLDHKNKSHEYINYRSTVGNTTDDSDDLFEPVKRAVIDEIMKIHKWEKKAEEVLRLLQLNTLEDRTVADKRDWDNAISFFETSVKGKLKQTEEIIRNMFGPSAKERWLYWMSLSETENKRHAVKAELDKLLNADKEHPPNLSYDELTTIRNNLSRNNVSVENEFIRDVWIPLYRRHFFNSALNKVKDCRKAYHLYHQQVDVNCNEVVLFHRIQQMMKVTANALRQQITNREARRLDREIKDILDDYGHNTEVKCQLLTGHRVTLAEELKRVRQIQEKLEEFIQALNKEK